MICPFGFEVGDPAVLGACVLPSTISRCHCVEVVAEWVVDPTASNRPKVLGWWEEKGEL